MDIVERMEACTETDYGQCLNCPYVEDCDQAKANKKEDEETDERDHPQIFGYDQRQV